MNAYNTRGEITPEPKVIILNIQPANVNEWDEMWQKCDYSTYYHSRQWAEIVNAYTRGEITPEPKIIIFSDGKRVLIPLLSQKKYLGLIKDYYSSYDGTYGGQISDDQLTPEHTSLIKNYLTKELGDLRWRINPFDELAVKDCVKT